MNTEPVVRDSIVADPRAFKKLEAEAVELVGEIDRNFVKLGAVLARVKRIFDACGGEDYAAETLGHRTMHAWADALLGMQRRKAYYYADIYSSLVEKAGYSEAQVLNMSWTKAREIAPVARAGLITTPAERKDWEEKALTQTREDLSFDAQSAIEEAETGVPRDREEKKMKTMSFTVGEAEMLNINRALDTARRLTGNSVDRTGYLLDKLALEFNGTYPDHVTSDEALCLMLARVKDMFRGRRLLAIDANGDVLFGAEDAKAFLAALNKK